MPSQGWFDPKIAPTIQALRAGDGCHPDEAKALGDYLNGTIPAQEAAKQFTAPVLGDATPTGQLYRIWALLAEALVELTTEERHSTLDLLAAIQALPPSSEVEWSKLAGFASMWHTLYRLHLQGPDRWEMEVEGFSEQKKHKLRQDYDAIGSAEAEMFVRGFDAVVHENWGYKVLDLLCSKGRALDIFLSHTYAWLRIAGVELKAKVDWSQTKATSTHAKWQMMARTTAGHWETWKEELLKLSKDGRSRLSDTGRKLAAQCYDLM